VNDEGLILHRNVAVIEVEDAHVFKEIRALIPLDNYALGALSETELIVDPRRLKELLDQLVEKGLAPLVRRSG
jgi:hypothetical protein